MGIPHSQFHGGDGTWTQDDRDKAIAYQREMRSRCHGCGTRKEDWAENPDAYVGDIEICEGCARLAAESENDAAKRPGAKVQLIPLGAGVRKMRSMDGEL